MGMTPAKYFPQPTTYGNSPQQGAIGPTPPPDQPAAQPQLDLRPPGPEPGLYQPPGGPPAPITSPMNQPNQLQLNPNLAFGKKLPYAQGGAQ